MIFILLAFAGITGIGKSYYTNKICENLGFSRIKILTTRKPRIGEKNGIEKIFVTESELNKYVLDSKIAYKFELLGVKYAYLNEDIFSNEDKIFELHYSTIYDFKKVNPNLRTIYLMPKDINIAKQKLMQRKLNPETEKKRLLEIDEHYNKITTDKSLLNMFDYIMYNNYDKKSEDEIINLVKSLKEEDLKNENIFFS